MVFFLVAFRNDCVILRMLKLLNDTSHEDHRK